MDLNSVYVTVGTTKFDDLITELFTDEILAALKTRGCKKLTIQYGNGEPPKCELARRHGIEVDAYQFKFGPTREDIIQSDLTIGHAGAGTCMDILKYGKPGLLVVNENLMDNHQVELAEQLAKDGYIFQCNLNSLAKNLISLNPKKIVQYERSNGMPDFISHLIDMMEK